MRYSTAVIWVFAVGGMIALAKLAHGAEGPYETYCSEVRPACVVQTKDGTAYQFRIPTKEMAEDLAAALNDARERRTHPHKNMTLVCSRNYPADCTWMTDEQLKENDIPMPSVKIYPCCNDEHPYGMTCIECKK